LTAALRDHIVQIQTARFIMYERAIRYLEDLEDIFNRPPRARMPNRLLVGPTNNGKSMLLEEFIARHPREDNPEKSAAFVPIVIVQVDGPDNRQLFSAILKYVNAPTTRSLSSAAMSDQVLSELSTVGTKILIIDEFHSLLGGTGIRQTHFRNVIKRLSNLLRIPIVAAGTELAYNALQADEQLANRFYPLHLPRWTDSEEFGRLLMSFKRFWEIEFDEDVVGAEVLKRTDRTIGAISELMERAAIYSLRERGRAVVDEEALKNCKYISPGDRPQLR
jgi:hypothetical protein